MDINRPSPAPEPLLSTPTHGKEPTISQPSPSPSPSLRTTTTTPTPSTTHLRILHCTPASLTYLLPLLTATIPLNPFTILMLKPPHNTQPTAHQNLATWLYTLALRDPRAKLFALTAVEGSDQPPDPHNLDQPSLPGPGTTTNIANKPAQNPHARVLGVAWLQHFFLNEEWEHRYPPHIDKRSRQIPHVIDTKAYARALKLLYTHREDCVGSEEGWYIRSISTKPGSGSEDFICHLLEHAVVEANRNGDGVVFWQGPPFRNAGRLYDRIGMGWRRMVEGRRVGEGEGKGQGLDWIGWVTGGEGEVEGE